MGLTEASGSIGVIDAKETRTRSAHERERVRWDGMNENRVFKEQDVRAANQQELPFGLGWLEVRQCIVYRCALFCQWENWTPCREFPGWGVTSDGRIDGRKMVGSVRLL